MPLIRGYLHEVQLQAVETSKIVTINLNLYKSFFDIHIALRDVFKSGALDSTKYSDVKQTQRLYNIFKYERPST